MTLSPHYRRERNRVYEELGVSIRSLACRANINRDLQDEIWKIAAHACAEAMRVGINTGRARAKQRAAATRRAGRPHIVQPVQRTGVTAIA